MDEGIKVYFTLKTVSGNEKTVPANLIKPVKGDIDSIQIGTIVRYIGESQKGLGKGRHYLVVGKNNEHQNGTNSVDYLRFE